MSKENDAFLVRKKLQVVADVLGDLPKCALLGRPSHVNLGDHLIWLGNLFYLSSVMNTKIGYSSSIGNFSPQKMEGAINKSTILLHGGGNFGDIWYTNQKFREEIIERYRDRPIVMLPQTIYFEDPGKLEQTSRIFNSHPNLTIFTRDHISYNLAKQSFDACHTYLVPDMAFQLTHLVDLDFPRAAQYDRILYHCRTDTELLKKIVFDNLPLPIDVSDWRSYEEHWVLGSENSPIKQLLATVIREGWQRGLRHLPEWLSRCEWDTKCRPNTILDAAYDPSSQYQSWSFIHSAVYQFRQYRLVITNRLHGHILATLLGIPHVFLPNNYHKNKAFYETWTANIPYCKFVESPEKVRESVVELLSMPSDS